jgi:hypothetical protein
MNSAEEKFGIIGGAAPSSFQISRFSRRIFLALKVSGMRLNYLKSGAEER